MNKLVFLDTNILVYSKDEASPFFGQVCEALKGLVLQGIDLCINRQVLREYACVVTRPAPRGLGIGHNINHILTLNTKDFLGIQEIIPVKPEHWQRIT